MISIKRTRTLVIGALGILVSGALGVAAFLRERPPALESLDLVREGDRLKSLEITCWDVNDYSISSTITVRDRGQLDMMACWLASREDSWEALEEGALSLRVDMDGVFVFESGREIEFVTGVVEILLEGHARRMDDFDYRFLRSYCGEF